MKLNLMQRIQKSKENRKKGFTLVELIAVIVILGILMAIMVPNFIGYMNKANEAEEKVVARSLYVAANAIAAEKKYVASATADAWKGTASGAGVYDEVVKLAALNGTGMMPLTPVITMHKADGTPATGTDEISYISVTYGKAVITGKPN